LGTFLHDVVYPRQRERRNEGGRGEKLKDWMQKLMSSNSSSSSSNDGGGENRAIYIGSSLAGLIGLYHQSQTGMFV
jgi:hypothetical protein